VSDVMRSINVRYLLTYLLTYYSQTITRPFLHDVRHFPPSTTTICQSTV